jgi:hypothetical protein
MGKAKYSDAEFTHIVKTSYSVAQVLKRLGLVPIGGNYKTVKRKVKLLNLSISHFTGQGHLRGKTHNWAKKKPLEEILVKNSDYNNTSALRRRLFRENVFEQRCYNCGLSEWLGEPISLELEHKNGNSFDNRIENLTILCPNCHSQTETFRGRNKDKIEYYCLECNREISGYSRLKLCLDCYHKKNIRNKEINVCDDCGRPVHKRSNLCNDCSHFSNRKVKNRPPKEQLLKEIQETSYCAVGRQYGVSDNAVRKWINKPQ